MLEDRAVGVASVKGDEEAARGRSGVGVEDGT
jgi:hypothetical protein